LLIFAHFFIFLLILLVFLILMHIFASLLLKVDIISHFDILELEVVFPAPFNTKLHRFND